MAGVAPQETFALSRMTLQPRVQHKARKRGEWGEEVEKISFDIFGFTFLMMTPVQTAEEEEDTEEKVGGEAGGAVTGGIRRFECICETAEERDEWLRVLGLGIEAARALDERRRHNRYEIPGLESTDIFRILFTG